MDFVPIVVTRLVGALIPDPDAGAEMDSCDTSNSIDIVSDIPSNLRAETEELVALKREHGMFSHFEQNVIRFDLDLVVIFVMFFDEVDEAVPVLSIHDPVGQMRNHVEADVDAHGYFAIRANAKVR